MGAGLVCSKDFGFRFVGGDMEATAEGGCHDPAAFQDHPGSWVDIGLYGVWVQRGTIWEADAVMQGRVSVSWTRLGRDGERGETGRRVGEKGEARLAPRRASNTPEPESAERTVPEGWHLHT